VSDATLAARAFYAVLRRDLHVFLSYRTRLVSQALTVLFSLTLFYYVSQLVSVRGFGSHQAYFGFVIVGLALVSVMYSCFSIPELVRQELVAGTFDRLVLSPFGPVRSVIAMTLFPMLYSFFIAAITLGIGYALYGLHLNWPTVPISVPVMALVLLAFLPFGLLFAALTLVVKQGNVGTSWVIAGLSIVGGLYFPVTLLPHWLQTTSKLQPFTAATEVLRQLLVGGSPSASTGPALWKLTAFAAVLLPVSIAILAAAIRTGQRRGTIIEY
jgi:ABC-2 type transport system permease protein